MRDRVRSDGGTKLFTFLRNRTGPPCQGTAPNAAGSDYAFAAAFAGSVSSPRSRLALEPAVGTAQLSRLRRLMLAEDSGNDAFIHEFLDMIGFLSRLE
jgi:hypothetical protein